VASKWNPQTTIINSSSASVTVLANPSSVAFMYVWHLMLTTTAATFLTFEQLLSTGATSALTGPYDLSATGGSLTWPDANSPWLTIDPGASLVIKNSASATISGQVLCSN